MTIVLLLLVVLLVIAFFVFLWKSAATWGWPALTLAALAFLLALVFVPLVGMSMKARIAWQKVRTDLEERLERETAEQERIKYGTGQLDDAQALVPLQMELRRLRADAGRVWRQLRLDGAGPQAITLTIPAAPEDVDAGDAGDEDADADDAAAVATAQIPEDLIVYGFAEGRGPAETTAVPVFYLGEFRVAAAQDGQVTLEPTIPLSDEQRDAIRSGRAGRWALYEVMPVDSHEPFVAEGSEPDEEQLFGRVDEDLVRQLLEGEVRPETLDAYLRDGSRARPDDPPATRWVKIEFTQEHEVVVDSPEQRSALDSGYFDGAGQAVDSRLQRGEKGPVQFRQGQQLVVKQEAADDLINRGVARLIDTYFVRPLNDYSFGLLNLIERMEQLEEKKVVLQRETNVLQKAHDLNIDMITTRQGEKAELEKEVAQYGREREALESFVAELESNIDETRQRLAALYRENLQLAQQLATVQADLQEQIDARTDAAAREAAAGEAATR